MADRRKQRAKTVSKRGISKRYLRLLEGEINSKEYTDGVKLSVDRAARRRKALSGAQ